MNTIQKRYTPKEFARLLHISVKTLQRWDRTGKLVAGRTSTDRRVYTELHLHKILDQEKLDIDGEVK